MYLDRLIQYVYARTLREMDFNGKKIWVVLARSETVPSIPEQDGVIRVDDYLQSCALTTDGKVGSKGMNMYISGFSILLSVYIYSTFQLHYFQRAASHQR